MPRNGLLPRVVLDTDTANEIDDQFALAWALRAPDAMRLEGVHAAPFSHGHFFENLARASQERGGPSSRFDEIALSMTAERREELIRSTAPDLGAARSHEEILRVFEAAEVDPGARVKRGSPAFMDESKRPVESESVAHLIELAHSASPEDPIHVAIIGAPTNVASALLVDPTIAPNLVVLFLAGYPSAAGLDDDSFNLVQDRVASNVLFESDVPLVYIPGYHVAETLQLSLPAAERWLEGKGRLADFLYQTYLHNPINPDVEAVGKSWVLWDIIAVARLVDPSWVPTRETPRARVRSDHRWEPLEASAGTMEEAYHTARNEIFGDLFRRIAPRS